MASSKQHVADSHDLIRVQGARVNNLKDVSVEIPKRRLTVFTGVSGYKADGWAVRMFSDSGFLDPDKPIRDYTKTELHDFLGTSLYSLREASNYTRTSHHP